VLASLAHLSEKHFYEEEHWKSFLIVKGNFEGVCPPRKIFLSFQILGVFLFKVLQVWGAGRGAPKTCKGSSICYNEVASKGCKHSWRSEERCRVPRRNIPKSSQCPTAWLLFFWCSLGNKQIFTGRGQWCPIQFLTNLTTASLPRLFPSLTTNFLSFHGWAGEAGEFNSIQSLAVRRILVI